MAGFSGTVSVIDKEAEKMRKQTMVLAMAVLTLVTGVTTACAAENNPTVNVSAEKEVSENNKVLIAYFTWADNTVVEKPEEVDVDASTSASVLAPGNAAMMAGWIQEETGGDLFSIQVEDPYSSDYDTCLDRAADEKAEDARPSLKTHVEDMDDYDIVFLGFPNWWYTIPMAVHSFIEEYDFSGKTVIPFVTHGTGGLANCINDLTAALPESTEVLEPIGVYRDDVKNSKDEVQEWVKSLGIDFSTDNNEDEKMGENNIKFTFDEKEIIVKMEDNSAADDLVSKLPLTLDFEDYNGTEKISYLDSELDISDAPDACTPLAGTLAYYAPWGNLAFFYHDFRESPQLIPLGEIVSGQEYLEEMDQAKEVTIDIYKE